MIQFMCKQADFKELIMCSFGISKGSYRIMVELLKNKEWQSIKQLQKTLGVERSSVQKALSELLSKKLVKRRQINQEKGGYFYIYKCINRQELKSRMINIIDEWTRNIKLEIEAW